MVEFADRTRNAPPSTRVRSRTRERIRTALAAGQRERERCEHDTYSCLPATKRHRKGTSAVSEGDEAPEVSNGASQDLAL